VVPLTVTTRVSELFTPPSNLLEEFTNQIEAVRKGLLRRSAKS